MRDKKVNALNAKYSSMRGSGQTQSAALYSLVNKYPYRLITLKSTKVNINNSISTLSKTI